MSEVLPQVMIAFEPSSSGVSEELGSRGHEIIRVDDEEQAAESVAAQLFELCLIWGEGAAATKLCEQVRKTPRGAVTPILIVGGPAFESRDAALDGGADAFVEQAASEPEILARVAGLLGVSDEPGPSGGDPPPDPVEEALTAAEAVAPPSSPPPPLAQRGSIPPGQASLAELIEQVEQELLPTIERGDGAAEDLPEDLNALDIEADLGRPAELEEGDAEHAEGDAEVDEKNTDAEDDADVPSNESAPETDPGPDDEEVTRPGFNMPRASNHVAEETAEGGGIEPGRLEDQRLWSVLARALAERVSGMLVVRRPGVERKLFLEDGEPLLAVSTAREDRLIELLYREGRLSEEQYQRASLTVSESGRRVGVVLVERGLIASRELFPLVRHHYEMLIFDTFSWGEGEYRFEAGERSRGERILLDVPGAALIVEGLRSRASAADLEAIVTPDARPLRRDNGIRPLEEVGLAPVEHRLVEDCDGHNSVGDLSRLHDLPEPEVRGLLAGLAVLGWIEVAGADASARPSPAPGMVVVAGDRENRVERARVSDKLTQVEEGTYFALMEIPPQASGHEIRKAYRRLRGQFAPERFAVSDLADLREQVEVIRMILDEAYEILRDPSLREAYRQALGERI